MEWSRESATNAYLDTIKLCNDAKEKNISCDAQEPESREFLSALAAGMSAKVIVEVTSEVSTSTVALAAAARQTGGKLVCILPQPNLDETHRAIRDSGLNDMVEFQTGDPIDVLQNIENVDFSVVDCQSDDYAEVLDKLDVNPKRSVVVTNNIVEGRRGLGWHLRRVENKAKVRSMKNSIGKGMEVTMIEKGNDIGRKERIRNERRNGIGKLGRKSGKSKWVCEIDEKSGEEHIFRIPPKSRV